MQERLDALVSSFSPSQLKQYSLELSDRYRKRLVPFLAKREHRFAYLVTRLPATLAAITRVLREIPLTSIESFLDLGAGPGTGYLAAKDVFPQIGRATLLETDSVFIEIGKKLITDRVEWIKQDLKEVLNFAPYDLVLLSYSIGEIPEKYWEPILKGAWSATQKAMVIIEPGTPAGFARIREIRSLLLSWGAHMIAPCPHAAACPMKEPDWCHFSQRLERNSLHKMAKEGSLGFEDEKFSYLVVSKEVVEVSGERILRPPQRRKGHTIFSLCTQEGLKNKVVSQKDKEFYKFSKKLDWGDVLR